VNKSFVHNKLVYLTEWIRP